MHCIAAQTEMIGRQNETLSDINRSISNNTESYNNQAKVIQLHGDLITRQTRAINAILERFNQERERAGNGKYQNMKITNNYDNHKFYN